MEINLAQAHKTTSGVFVRRDENVGLFAYSPYTGLTYAIQESDAEAVYKWLNKKTKQVSDNYKKTLGAGWATDINDFTFFDSHLLPNRESWSTVVQPVYPLLINWFLTGRCPLGCLYCYAEDLMRQESLEPNEEDIKTRVLAILKLNPLVVVLTGGDPLFSPHIRLAIELLSNRVGIVVDTSAYTFTQSHLELFKKNNVNVRISLDSERPKLNQFQRPIYYGYPQLRKKGRLTAEVAVEALSKCLDAGLTVTVQTVATKKTANDLIALGDKLYRLGVRSWRVFKVSPSKASYEGYKSLVGSFTDSGKEIKGKQSRGPYEFVFSEIKKSIQNAWNNKMAVQVTHNSCPNNVILLGPDGKFYTESNINLRKVLLSEASPQNPPLENIRQKVNMMAHAERYLNIER